MTLFYSLYWLFFIAHMRVSKLELALCLGEVRVCGEWGMYDAVTLPAVDDKDCFEGPPQLQREKCDRG